MDGHKIYSSPNFAAEQWYAGGIAGNGVFQDLHYPSQIQYTQHWQNDYRRNGAGNLGNTSALNSLAIQGPRDEHIERELFAGINSGINFDKYEDIPVEASGSNVPPPCRKFDELPLHPWIHENVKKSGYVKPTPVQKYSIPCLLARRDLMSCAQTGSGKTAAFLIPLINHILRSGPGVIKAAQTMSNGRRCQFPVGLVLSPTRELAMQTHKETLKFAYRTNILSAVLYGGRENYRDQINKLRLGCHILIATPGRLLDVMEQGLISLEKCIFLILDEADRMLDMGFEPQIRQIVENHKMPAKGERVTAMFSATFPKEIQVLAKDFLSNYIFLAVGRVGSTSENITQRVIWVEELKKRKCLMDLLDDDRTKGLTLVFVETKRGANELTSFLQRNGYYVVTIHGDLKQLDRERNLEMFRTGQVNVLVATAVAARGLDIPNVMHVINYDLPTDIDEYVHRIGRTGRAGNTGLSSSFYNEKNNNIGRDLVDLLVETKQEIPQWLDQIVRDGLRSAPRFNQKNRIGRFGGRDHRLQNQVGGMRTSHSTPSFQLQTMNANFASPPPWNQSGEINYPNIFTHNTALRGDGLHQSASSSCFHGSGFNENMINGDGPDFMYKQWSSAAANAHTGRFYGAMVAPYGGNFNLQPAQAAINNWATSQPGVSNWQC